MALESENPSQETPFSRLRTRTVDSSVTTHLSAHAGLVHAGHVYFSPAVRYTAGTMTRLVQLKHSSHWQGMLFRQ
jgi:hypothetical protein